MHEIETKNYDKLIERKSNYLNNQKSVSYTHLTLPTKRIV